WTHRRNGNFSECLVPARNMVSCCRLAANMNWRRTRLDLPTWPAPGYDPRESVAFWKRMMAASQGAKPPELMSTHPSDQTRIDQLEQLMPAALEIYQKAVQQ